MANLFNSETVIFLSQTYHLSTAQRVQFKLENNEHPKIIVHPKSLKKFMDFSFTNNTDLRKFFQIFRVTLSNQEDVNIMIKWMCYRYAHTQTDTYARLNIGLSAISQIG